MSGALPLEAVALWEAAPDALVLVAADGRIVANNRRFEELLGWQRGVLVGRSFATLVPDRLGAGLVERMAELHTGGAPLERRLVCRTPEQREVLVHARVVAVAARGEHMVCLALRPLASEESPRAADDTLGTLGHELRTPLNAVLGFAQLLHWDCAELSERHAEMVGHIVQGGEQLQRLIDDAVELSRLQRGADQPMIEPVDVCSLLGQWAAELEGKAEARGVRLVVVAPEHELPAVAADREQLLRALVAFGAHLLEQATVGTTLGASLLETPASIRLIVRGAGHERPAHEPLALRLARTLLERMGMAVRHSEPGDPQPAIWVELPLSL